MVSVKYFRHFLLHVCLDRQKVQTALTKKQFKQRKLTVDSIPVSCTVLVNGLPVNQHVSEDTLTNYFENTKRSGGGDVWGVEMFINEQYALVTFDKPDGGIMIFVCIVIVSTLTFLFLHCKENQITKTKPQIITGKQRKIANTCHPQN